MTNMPQTPSLNIIRLFSHSYIIACESGNPPLSRSHAMRPTASAVAMAGTEMAEGSRC